MTLSGKQDLHLRLCVIPDGSQIDPWLLDADPDSAIAAEFNESGWVRPSIFIPAKGFISAHPLSFKVTGPTGGISIKQIIAIVGGSETPRDPDRLCACFSGEFPDPIAITEGKTYEFPLPPQINISIQMLANGQSVRSLKDCAN